MQDVSGDSPKLIEINKTPQKIVLFILLQYLSSASQIFPFENELFKFTISAISLSLLTSLLSSMYSTAWWLLS